MDSIRYEFFTPHNRGLALVFDFLRDCGGFTDGPFRIIAKYGYENCRETPVYAYGREVGSAHSLWESYAGLAPAYQAFMRKVEFAATDWQDALEAGQRAAERERALERQSFCERIVGSYDNG
jgi:hypothetical protein